MSNFITSIFAVATLGIAITLFPACDGLFDDMYDNGKTSDNNGKNSSEGKIRQFCIDATEYTQWQYVDLENDEISFVTSLIENDTTETGVPDKWTIALHRYDVKTNNCTAAPIDYQSVSELVEAVSVDKSALEQLDYKADIFTDKKITIDMSHMMEGRIGYAKSYYNEVISSWLNIDMSVMPPIYSMTHTIFVLKTSNGRFFALNLVNYMNDKSEKGYMTVEYARLD